MQRSMSQPFFKKSWKMIEIFICYDRRSLATEWRVDRSSPALTTRASAIRTPCALGIQRDTTDAVAEKVSKATATTAKVIALDLSIRHLYYFSFNLVIPKHDGKFLLISHGMSILRVPIQPSPSMPGRPIFVHIFQAAVGKIEIIR